jgi:hypothetical protein
MCGPGNTNRNTQAAAPTDLCIAFTLPAWWLSGWLTAAHNHPGGRGAGEGNTAEVAGLLALQGTLPACCRPQDTLSPCAIEATTSTTAMKPPPAAPACRALSTQDAYN